MSYSYIKSVFPNFEASKVYDERVYNSLDSMATGSSLNANVSRCDNNTESPNAIAPKIPYVKHSVLNNGNGAETANGMNSFAKSLIMDYNTNPVQPYYELSDIDLLKPTPPVTSINTMPGTPGLSGVRGVTGIIETPMPPMSPVSPLARRPERGIGEPLTGSHYIPQLINPNVIVNPQRIERFTNEHEVEYAEHVRNANSTDTANKRDNLRYYNIPIPDEVMNMYTNSLGDQSKMSEKQSGQNKNIERFENGGKGDDVCNFDCEKYITHILECVPCRGMITKQLQLDIDRSKNEEIMEVISYMIFGIFMLLLLDAIKR